MIPCSVYSSLSDFISVSIMPSTFIYDFVNSRVSFFFFKTEYHFIIYVCIYIFTLHIYIVSVYRSYIHLVKLIPKNFILFDAALNDKIFLSSFYSSSLLLYINSTDFCIILKNKRRTKYKASRSPLLCLC